jgi:peptidoglycan hydrolase-like protein with peptidoglycan-binding domain
MTITLAGSVGDGGANNRDDVSTVQALLDGVAIADGGPDPKLVVDGLNGSKTIGAISDFQSQHGLASTGRIEPAGATFSQLLSDSRYVADATIGSSVGANAPAGNDPQDVAVVQALLNAVPTAQGGPSPRLVVDGLIGSKTIGAITGYQQAQALGTASGRVDPGDATLASLNATAQLTLTAHMALRILETGRITLATSHLSGVPDKATVRQNIFDTADGQAAARSAYGTAPGGTVRLEAPVLNLLLVIEEGRTSSITELAGGSHSSNSRHYVGVAIDVGDVGGSQVSATNPDVTPVMQLYQDLGCTELLGPGDPGHDQHIHAALPRP